MVKHNFNAGPSVLPDVVIKKAAEAVLDFNGSGLSILSISHRTKDFDAVMDEAKALFPISVKKPGITRERRVLLPRKAPSPMLFMLPGRVR